MSVQKIATHISTVHPLKDTRIFYKQCQSLRDAGYHVNLVVTHDQDEVVEGINILALPLITNRWCRIAQKPWMAFKKALPTRADIYHFHDPELIPVGLILRILGKKVVYDVHEEYHGSILHKLWIPKPLRWLVAKIFYGIETVSSKFFSGIATATPHLESLFIKSNSRTMCANNYPMLKEMVAPTISAKDPRGVVYVGTITQDRGIVELIDALEDTDIKLYLAGDFYPTSLKEMCMQKPGWRNVDYLGFVDRRDVQALLSKASVGILTFHHLPNHDDCRPNKLFEYMSAGLPIVGSNIQSWIEFLADVDNVTFVDPLSPTAIREAILALLDDPVRCAEMGERGRKAVLDQFNWDHEAQKLLNLYNELLS